MRVKNVAKGAHEGGGDAISELGGDDGEHGGEVGGHADRLARAHHQTHDHEAHAIVCLAGDLVQNAARANRTGVNCESTVRYTCILFPLILIICYNSTYNIPTDNKA